MTLTWMINTTKGPAVGEADVSSRNEACNAVRDAVRAAFGAGYTTEHAVAVRSVCAHLTAAELPFTYRTKAFVVTLTT